MNHPDPNLEFSLDDLDLDDILDAAELETAIKQTAKERKVRTASPASATEPAVVKVKPSPWRATKSILVLTETSCRCGATFTSPGAKMPLAHFDHISKPDTVWEVAAHPSTLNVDLPRETRILRDTVEACPHCFYGGDAS